MKLKLLLAVLLTINCFSQSNVINDGSWFLIQINKGDEVINFPVDINGNPIFTEFSRDSKGVRTTTTWVCDFCNSGIEVNEAASQINILYGFCTLGGCDRGMPIPPNYDLANEFKIAEFLNFAGSVLDYEITEELADTPLQLKLTKANGDFLLYYFNTLSVSPLEPSKVITIYPNPVRDNISISSKVKISNTTFTILDISGKLIKSYNGLNENSIDVSTLEKGIYFMKITTDETTAITKKFIKI